MKKIRVLFHKAPLNLQRKHLISNIIRIYTGIWNWWTPGYSHSEIWTPDKEARFETLDSKLMPGMKLSRPIYCGTAWTSTMRDKENGTVKRRASQVITHPERWEWLEFEIEDINFQNLLAFMECEVKLNRGYALKDCLKFIGLGIFADKKRNICSEFCHNALICAGILRFPFKVVSPRRLWKMIYK